MVVRHLDGSFTVDRQQFPAASNILGSSVVGFLAGLVLGAPLVGATIGAMVGGAGTAMMLMSAGHRRRFRHRGKDTDAAGNIRPIRAG